MKRRSILVLVTLLVSVFTFNPASPVSACILNARDVCEQSTPIAGSGYSLSIVAAPTTDAAHSYSGYASENYVRMTTAATQSN